jgi:glycosyltransferase involved in cell wall biosynthesis
MKIAYCCADPGVPVFGSKGCSLHVQELLRAFRNSGGEVTLFATTRGGTPAADLADVSVVDLPAVGKGQGPERERAALAANAGLTEALRAHGPFDLVYERYSLWSHAAQVAAAADGVPGVLEVNAPLIDEQSRYRSLYDAVSAEAVARLAFAASQVLVAVSDEVAAYLNAFREAQGKIHVVANGVDVARFTDPIPSLPSTDGVFTIGFVGSLKPWHGVEVLLPAFAEFLDRVPDSRLLIVGEGPELERLQRRTTDLGLDGAVCFTGGVPPDAVPGLLASMDVAVAPYPQVSGFYFSPLKVYEYMAAGLPVVASRLGQLNDLIEDGTDGLLCTPGDPAALCAAMLRLQASPRLRSRLGRAAQLKVRAHHTWGAVARRVLQLSRVAVGPATTGGIG